MSIPTYDFLEKPFNDEFMTWNYFENRYVPLVDGVVKDCYVNLVVDWGTKENAQSYLDLLSRVVNEVILSFKDQKYRDKMLYYMAHSKQSRQMLLKIYSDSVWYNRRDGGFMMAYNSGVNLNQGKLIEFGIDKTLSPIAKQMIRNTTLGTRVLPIEINTKLKFADLTTLLAYLVTEEYITQEQADVVALSLDLADLPYHEDYDVVLLDSGSYLFTDLETLSKAILDMRNNNPIGTW